MFVQIINGKTTNAAALLALGDKWQKDVRPGAIGYLGSTIGVAPDGRFIAIAQFTDEVAAKENGSRPEQDAWYQEFTKVVDGEPTFRESTDTSFLFDGPTEAAGFVQVMETNVTDRAKAEALESEEMLAQLRQARPDLLGGLRVWLGNQAVEAAYFSSEADARKGEQSEEFSGMPEDMGIEVTGYLDLPNPQINLA